MAVAREAVLVDLAERRRVGRELGRVPVGELGACVEPLARRSVRARNASASSSKVRKISDSPNRLSLRIEIEPGVPLSTRSSGTRDLALDLLGREAGRLGDDVDLELVTSGKASTAVFS